MRLAKVIPQICYLIVAMATMADGYNFLFLLNFGSKSHKNVMVQLVESLGENGHKVQLKYKNKT